MTIHSVRLTAFSNAIHRSMNALLPSAGLLWALALICRAHLWATRPVPIWLNQDEGYIAALATRMLSGHWLPYVDGVSHRGPLLYYVTALWFSLFGHTLEAVRWLALVASMLVAVLLFAVGCCARRAFVGAVAALVWALTTVGWDLSPGDAIALNGELLSNVFILAGFAYLTRALSAEDGARNRRLFLSGLFGGAAALTKQTALAAVATFTVWLLAAALARSSRPRAARAHWLLSFALGACSVGVAIWVRYAVAGELSTLWYYLVQYNEQVYMAPFHGAVGRDNFGNWVAQRLPTICVTGALALGVVASSFGRGVRWVCALDENGFAVTALLATFAAGVTSNAALRGFGHYYLVVLPWAGLAIGHVLERVLANGPRASVASACTLGALAFGAYWGWSHEYGPRIEQSKRFPPTEPKASEICRYFQERVGPSESVFIWGFSAEPYTSCAVRSASRYVYTTFPAGVVPWYESSLEEENARAVPGSRAILLRELESSKPKVILDSKGSLMGRSMTRYPELNRYLQQHYCRDRSIFYGDLYLRKTLGAPCGA